MIKKFMVKNVSKLFNLDFSFLPILILVFTFKFTNSWRLAFILAGIFSIFGLIKAFKDKSKEIFFLSLNAFITFGSIIFLFKITFLQNIYGAFLYSTLFIWLLLISLILTFFTKDRLFKVTDKQKSLYYSLFFTVAVIVALIFSFYFKSDYFWGAWIPFVGIIFFRDLLNNFIKGFAFEKIYLLGAEVILIIIAAILKRYTFVVSLIFLLISRKLLYSFWQQKLNINSK